jgi:hypothetical protein
VDVGIKYVIHFNNNVVYVVPTVTFKGQLTELQLMLSVSSPGRPNKYAE